MRIAHLADLHCKEDAYDAVRASIETVIAEHERQPFDLIAIAGDIWHGPIQDSGRARFPEFLALIRKLADCAPVAMVYGYRHDMVDSLEVFETQAARFPIRILRPGKAYFLDGFNACISETYIEGQDKALLFGVPEPTKEWLLASGGATGKDASDLAIRDRLRALLLGLGGLRRQYPHLPCVLLYHGDVYGATTSVGYSTAAGTGIAVSRDDLAAVGFDYGAFGHIHLPQQIAGLPAYYAGKAYTGNWDERGYVPGANIVEIGNWPVDESGGTFEREPRIPVEVSRLEFPHPVRVKLSRKLDDGVAYKDLALGGKIVWEEWTATKEWAAEFDADAELEGLIQGCGALEGSRVTLNILPTETVRAGEIASKATLADKVALWGENSAVPIVDTVLTKAGEVESEVGRIDQLAGPPRRFRNISTYIRGSRGFYRKQKKDEAFIDWESYGEGVIAYVGPNGFGKTTSFDFSKPWPIPVSRRPKTLKAHFRLKDSVIENVYLEEVSGTRYRTLINIDGANKSGGAEYFLYRDDGQGWQPVPGTNGRLDPFLEAVESIFGSMAIYLRTAFVPQKPSKDFPDIGEATQEEKKGLIAELAGKDFAPYQAAANAKGKALDSEVIRLDAVVDAAIGIDEAMAGYVAEISAQEKAEAQAVQDATDSEGRGKAFSAELEVLRLRVADLDRRAARKAEIETAIASLRREIQEDDEKAVGFQEAAKGRAEAEKALEEIRDLEEKATVLRDARDMLNHAYQGKVGEYHAALTAYEAKRRSGQATLDTARGEASKIERELATAEAKLSAPVLDHCPTCNQLLPDGVRSQLAGARETLEKAIGQLVTNLSLAKAGIRLAEKALEELTAPKLEPQEPFAGANALAELEADLSMMDAAAARETIRKADEAAVRIEEAARRKAEKTARIDAVTQEAAELGDIDAEPIRAQLEAKKREYEAERETYASARSAIAAARASADAARRNLSDSQAKKTARDAAVLTRAEKIRDRDEWALLERAIEGVRDLELDALAPSIAEIATRLLQSSGDNGHIEIETTRTSSGSAKKAKQIEDFLIFYVAEDGEQQDIATCSGGEMVWQRKALYDAFAVMRSRNAGIRFTTALLDETDGALHPARKMDYFRMLEAAHKESERFQTVLITQSSELAAMAASTINVADLGPRKDAQGVAA
jgi:DNA repair exonuclease SbcCD nuclease subunit